MERWRTVWRDGIVPSLSINSLLALREALRRDDPRLHQGSTTVPTAHVSQADYPCEGACAIGLSGWLGHGLGSVGAVDEFFSRVCWEADQRLHESASCRWFLNWFDDMPRSVMRRDLLAETELALALRQLKAELRPEVKSSPAPMGLLPV